MLAALVLAAAASLPPIAIRVGAPATMPRHVVSRVLDEASTIWHESGVRLTWRAAVDGEPALQIIIDDDPGPAAGGAVAVGWIRFDGGTPRPEIHLSRANVISGLASVRGPRGMWKAGDAFGDDDIIATALGRALAHEVGHYLLGSRVHGRGLMAAEWTAEELFGADRPMFRLSAADRAAVVDRLSREAILAQR